MTNPSHPIIWLTGQSGAGKTTLANALHKELKGVILDGDEMRNSISIGLGFSKGDREEHNLRVARLAKTLGKRSTVIVSVIAPFASTRKKIDEIAKPIWVYVKRSSLTTSKDKPYEEPDKPHIVVDSDKQTTAQQLEIVVNYLVKL